MVVLTYQVFVRSVTQQVLTDIETVANLCWITQQTFVGHVLCSCGLVESSAKPFPTHHCPGSVGMTKVLPLCPCPELHIPTGIWAALMPHWLGWALIPAKFFSAPPLDGFCLWMDGSLGITIPHLEHFLLPSCTLLHQPGHIGHVWSPVDTNLK